MRFLQGLLWDPLWAGGLGRDRVAALKEKFKFVGTTVRL